jgi:hypothetical protein
MFAWFQRRARGAWVVGTLVAMMLGGSAWLQWQVNRFPFFAYYALRQPLQGVHTPARDEFFFGRPYGWIVSSMWAARARLDELPWWAEIKSRTSPIQAEQYERRVRSVLGRSNLYFLGVSHPSSVERQSAP